MGEVKWIKLTTDMFENRKIKHIRTLPEGNNIVLIWVMLLTMAGRCNAGGMIYLTENIPYTPKLLADELNFDESVIVLALSVLEKMDMIVLDEEKFEIPGWGEYQSAEGLDKIRQQNRERASRYREKKKQERIEEKPKEIRALPEPNPYEFSKRSSNLTNLNIILKKYDEYMFFYDNPNILECAKRWMTYKDAKPKASNHYDTEIGIKMLLNKFIKNCQEYGMDSVISVVDDSIVNNYAGITWARLGKMKTSKEYNDWRNS